MQKNYAKTKQKTSKIAIMQNAELAENRMQNACCAELQKCRKITESRIAETAECRIAETAECRIVEIA